MAIQKPWDTSEDAKLRRFWKEGLTTSEIGRRMFRTTNSIIGRAHRIKLDLRQSPIKKDPTKPKPVARRRVGQGMKGDTLSKLIPGVVIPATRTTDGGREVKMDTRRDAIRGSTLDSTKDAMAAPLAFTAIGSALTCQWIEGVGPPWEMCGAKATACSSYCATHKALAYVDRAREPIAHNVGF